LLYIDIWSTIDSLRNLPYLIHAKIPTNYALFSTYNLCPTVFNLYRGIIFAHVITMGLLLIKGQVLRISRISLVFNKNTKEILSIIFIFIRKKTIPEIVFLVSLVFNKNTKYFIIIIIIFIFILK
jgi:hypothetical protein